VFVDRACLRVAGGKGGNGAVSFRREKYVPRGGPDGGRGGDGGNVVIRASSRRTSLYEASTRKSCLAADGKNGGRSNRTGARGEDAWIEVPVGTQVLDRKSGALMCDLDEEGKKAVVARGGRGGRGNASFATPVNQAPRIAENGRPGERREIVLELKSIGDVGIIGLPNAGKSTLLSVMSRAQPFIAEYPFSTLEPNLGVCEHGGERIVLVDIPGIVEGASRGTGLGLDFLRHVERTRYLLHLVDVSPPSLQEPEEGFLTLRRELAAYHPTLIHKPYAVVATKLDIPGSDEGLSRLRLKLPPEIPVFAVSAPTGRGIDELLDHMVHVMRELPLVSNVEKNEESFPPVFGEDEIPVVRLTSPFMERLLEEAREKGKETEVYINRRLAESGFERYLRSLPVPSRVEISGMIVYWDGKRVRVDND